MTRCALSLASRRAAQAVAPLIAASLLLGAALPAAAQVQRQFPQRALRGEISFGEPPAIRLNQQLSQLAPGARIRDAANMMVVSGALSGQKFIVNYTLDSLGQPLDIWLLRADEVANKPWPRTALEAQSWAFDPAAQAWTRP